MIARGVSSLDVRLDGQDESTNFSLYGGRAGLGGKRRQPVAIGLIADVVGKVRRRRIGRIARQIAGGVVDKLRGHGRTMRAVTGHCP